jgi:hypothetical protein
VPRSSPPKSKPVDILTGSRMCLSRSLDSKEDGAQGRYGGSDRCPAGGRGPWAEPPQLRIDLPTPVPGHAPAGGEPRPRPSHALAQASDPGLGKEEREAREGWRALKQDALTALCPALQSEHRRLFARVPEQEDRQPHRTCYSPGLS